MTIYQKMAWLYSGMFFFTVSLGYIPGFTDQEGMLFGLFTIDPIDDILHGGSGLWAALAGWFSGRASLFYFRTFGTLYFLDAVVGLAFGNGYLDLGVVLDGIAQINFGIKVAANLPHFLIGGIALIIGFAFSRKHPLSP